MWIDMMYHKLNWTRSTLIDNSYQFEDIKCLLFLDIYISKPWYSFLWDTNFCLRPNCLTNRRLQMTRMMKNSLVGFDGIKWKGVVSERCSLNESGEHDSDFHINWFVRQSFWKWIYIWNSFTFESNHLWYSIGGIDYVSNWRSIMIHLTDEYSIVIITCSDWWKI